MGGGMRAVAELDAYVFGIYVPVWWWQGLIPCLMPPQTAGSTSPHFTLAATGVAITEGQARSILYASGECLCVDKVRA